MPLEDLEQAALRQSVPLAQLVRGGTRFVPVHQIGDGVSRQPTIQPPRFRRAAVCGRMPTSRCRINLSDDRLQPVRFPLFQVTSANPDSENPL